MSQRKVFRFSESRLLIALAMVQFLSMLVLFSG